MSDKEIKLLKPILVIRFPIGNLEELNGAFDAINKLGVNNDYYVFIFQEERKKIKFEVFNLKDAKDLDKIDELCEEVKKNWENIKMFQQKRI
jgi:hypothetical protein